MASVRSTSCCESGLELLIINALDCEDERLVPLLRKDIVWGDDGVPGRAGGGPPAGMDNGVAGRLFAFNLPRRVKAFDRSFIGGHCGEGTSNTSPQMQYADELAATHVARAASAAAAAAAA
eukprot:CAMPEP_0169159442 /NCGR_PEP_ID=MMETSP1015-20121227/55816_1 /TAXON_ID=342587 /ORGANISM="Karlodinium micrum, Strain CCMP2283" /LENGTH=120 /DNA_ID=CAMNT_0009230837 /DNA_START=1 /DNA_END=360 /DNA_ORIENTATION=-